MIPKLLHYCWFGENPHSKTLQSCLESWKKLCPDFEIIEWNETNTSFTCNYAKQAYHNKKWAFLSDYVRINILVEHGGIYLDTDMLLLKSPHHLLKDSNLFIGEEKEKILSGGIIGAVPNHPYLIAILNFYQRLDYNLNSNVMIPSVLTHYYNLSHYKDDIKIYKSEYFYPIPYADRKDNYKNYLSEKTIAVHLWEESWKSPLDKFHHTKSFINLLEVIKIEKNKTRAFFHILRYLRIPELYYLSKKYIGSVLCIVISKSTIVKNIICDRQNWKLTQRELFTPKFKNFQFENYKFIKSSGLNFHVNINEYNGWRTLYNFYDSHLFDIVNKYIGQQATVIDVGGNIGFYTALFARQASNGNVHVFEPNLDAYKSLKKTVRLNNFNNIILNNEALGTTNELYTLINEDPSNIGKVHMKLSKIQNPKRSISLDAYVAEKKITTINFIKVDIEGYEYNFLQGAKTSIEKWRPIMYIELNDNFLHRYDSSAYIVMKQLEKWGYIVLENGINPINSKMSLINIATDILCIPQK